MIIIDILIKSIRWQKQSKINDFLQKTAKKILSQTDLVNFSRKNQNIIQLNIILLSDVQIKTINQQFRKQNKPTNVLSFANLDEKLLQTQGLNATIGNSNFIALGDILFSYETIDKEAKSQNKNFQNHLIHLLTHGILHLLGYDHQNTEMAKIMEEKEILILNKFNIPNPYL
jgi:probable rRNA maturation factor